LRRKGGDVIYLFEDRAFGTGMATSYCGKIAAEIAARADVPLYELGTIEGKGGVCGIGSHWPDWGALALTHERAARLWRRAARTGSVATWILLSAVALRVIFGH
jgi:hypothetical protein